MRFPLKLALSAVLAKSIVADLTQSSQAQSQPQPVAHNLDVNYQKQVTNEQQAAATGEYNQYVQNADGQSYAAVNQYHVQDPVQQYASSFGGLGDAVNAQSTDQVHTIVHPYAAYPDAQAYSNSYPSAIYSPNDYSSGAYNPGAFHVETGIDGYLVPGAPNVQKKAIESRAPSSLFSSLSNTYTALSTVLPSSVRSTVSFLTRSVSLIVSMLGMTLLGGGITAAICTFTPLCTITFAVPFLGVRRNVEKIAAEYLGNENFEKVQKAINTFSKAQTEEKTVDKTVDNTVEKAMEKTLDKTSIDEISTGNGVAKAAIEKFAEKESPKMDAKPEMIKDEKMADNVTA